jgi:hypothetical protein
MVKIQICWKSKCECSDEHYALNIESLMVVIKSYYNFRDRLHINSIQGAVLNSSTGISMNTFPSKVHNDACACYDTIMNDLSKQGYEIKFVSTMLEKYFIVHLQKKF